MIFEKECGDCLINNNHCLNSLSDLEEEKEKVEKLLNDIQYILNNYNNITPLDFYEHFKSFIKIKDEFYYNEKFDKDKLDIANLMYGTNYKKIIKIKTNMVYNSYHKEGHKKDLSWWYNYYQVCLYIATNKDLDKNKIYSIEEIKNEINSDNILIIGKENIKINDIDTINFKKEKYIEIKNTKEEAMSYENALGIILKNKYLKKDLFNYFKEYLNEAKNSLTYLRAGYSNFYLSNGISLNTETCFEEAGYNKIYKLYKDKFKRKVNWE